VSNQADKLRNLQADLAICEAATPGQWIATNNHTIERDFDGLWICKVIWGNDLQFIAEAREGWPYAIRRAMAAEARVAELERELKRLKGGECSCPGSA